MPQDVDKVRTFDTGATRNSDEGRPDYEGYLSPTVIERFGQYMTKHRKQADGSTRPSDNWQKGIPLDVYMKSTWRHFLGWWQTHRKNSPLGSVDENELEDTLCAMLFNVQGYLHEHLKKKRFGGSFPGQGFADKEKPPESVIPQEVQDRMRQQVEFAANSCSLCFRSLYRHPVKLREDGGFTRSCEFV